MIRPKVPELVATRSRYRLFCGALRFFFGAAVLLIAQGSAVFGEEADLGSRPTLLGDMGGLRPALEHYGVSLEIREINEVLGNVSGGTRRGAIYEGQTDLGLKLNLRPHFHWRGELYVHAFEIHGRGLSANNLGNNFNTASSIEASRTARLYELWYEQHIGDVLRVRIGQQNADRDFLVSTIAGSFVNNTFGWPALPSAALPSGGPAYPLATPAVRLRADVSDELTLFAAAFNGDPTGAGFPPGPADVHDLSGTAFRVNDGVLAMFEARYNPGNTAQNGTYKLGAWFNSQRFPDQRFDIAGLSLATPQSSGTPRLHNNNYSLYGIIDQPLFRETDSDNGLSLFLRAMGAPGDRNVIDFYLDAGLTYKGIFGRKDDLVGVALAFDRIGGPARALDRDTAAFTVTRYPVRSREMVVEITYQLQATPWCQLQPDFQYIFNPRGGVPNPDSPGLRIGSAAILGLRTTVPF
jgi:porin